MSNRYLGGFITATYNPLAVQPVVDYLVVAGGGGGGYDRAGGGGAGGLLTGTTVLASSTIYTITVGAGGAGGSSSTPNTAPFGNNSVFSSITTNGGGGGVGGYGAASQAPAGTTAQNPNPKADQEKLDAQQIQKSTNALAPSLNSQGAAQNLNKVKFSDTMTKLDDKPNTDLNAQELKQLEPLAVATSKALQNPQTANQMKQLITKSDTLDKAKEVKVQQAQQKVGTNQPQANQQQNPQQPPTPGQTK